jgi:hypothetical protein
VKQFGEGAGQSWRQMILDPPKPMRFEALGYFVFQNPRGISGRPTSIATSPTRASESRT